MADLRGVVPVIPAPFDNDGELDLSAIGPMVEFAIVGGMGAACLPAYGSEFYKMTDDERVAMVAEAVKVADGRLEIVAQANHPGTIHAARIARRMQDAGAHHIALALPRLFALSEDDLIRHSAAVADAVDIPLLIQDFNPGGATVGADFCVKLHERCPNFQHIKLEETMMGTKMEQIHAQTNGAVRMLDGWFGLYMMELVPRGCVGAMPDLAISDALQKVYLGLAGGRKEEVFQLFAELSPFISFALQSMEFYHHPEKRLLVERGVLKSAHVRDATLRLDESAQEYLEFLLEQLWGTLERHGLKRYPLS